jgi:hypothetical protein
MSKSIANVAFRELSEALPSLAGAEIEGFFRTRTTQPYLFTVPEVEAAKARLKRDCPEYVDALIERAGRAREHSFILAGNDPAGSFLFCGEPIRWHESPNGDREGLFTLNRHRWFFDLARAAWLTGEESYTATFSEQLRDWICSCPAPRDGQPHFHDFTPWKTLNGAIRVADAWLPSYELVRHSEAFPADVHILFLHSVLEHARELASHVFDTTHNHTVKEMGGLLSIALVFPEFSEAAAWRKLAVETLEACIRDQVFRDGVHFEATPAYHKLAIEWFVQPYLHGKRAGVSFSQLFEETLARMAQFAFASSFPDGTTVPIGDSDRNALERWSSDRDYLSRLVSAAMPVSPVPSTPGSDPDLLWLTGSIEAPSTTEVKQVPTAYPDGGFYIMRDRWPQHHAELKSESYLIVRNGPMNHGHAHADLLSFLLYNRGVLWLTDTGKYTYNESPRRKYLKGTHSHNTVVVDGADQAPYRDRMSFQQTPAWSNEAWLDGEELKLYQGSHEGFSRLAEPIRHRRQIVWLVGEGWLIIDRFTGKGTHVYDQLFHIPFSNGVSLSSGDGDDAKTQAVVRHDGESMGIIWIGGNSGVGSLHRSWVSPAYGEAHKARLIRYRVKASTPATILTWISFGLGQTPVVEHLSQESVSVLLGSPASRRLHVGFGRAVLEESPQEG